MKHLDLFSGIGGFALAARTVWGPEYINVAFVEIDDYCQQILDKNFPNSVIYGDIKTFTKPQYTTDFGDPGIIDLLTGGFPCQPFSVAGKRRGTEDDRHLWPEMLRVIREFHPRWIIGENVGGFVTWNDGMVLEQVHVDLESEGYEVQAFIIPACAVNAPHRRDRVWIIASNSNCERRPKRTNEEDRKQRNEQALSHISQGYNASNAEHRRREQEQRQHRISSETTRQETDSSSRNCGWDEPWPEVATRLCRMDDGIPRRVDRLRALGNAIVPQVAAEIMTILAITDSSL